LYEAYRASQTPQETQLPFRARRRPPFMVVKSGTEQALIRPKR